jgi:N-acyl homoserine lactone hydrolase
MRLAFLNGGSIDADRSIIHPGDDAGRRVTLPVMQVVIESEGKTMLVDTGMPPALAGNPDGIEQEYGVEPKRLRSMMTAEQRVDRQLELLGLSPEKLDVIVNTHCHFDHAGGNALFAGCTISVQEAELEAVHGGNGYLPIWDAPGLIFEAVSGDWSPLPGVEMYHTPGHTPGHQSMLVRVTDPPWLFAWDAVYTEEHWRTGKLGAVTDVAAARASIERLREIAEMEKARIIFGHDQAQWEAWVKAPGWYGGWSLSFKR